MFTSTLSLGEFRRYHAMHYLRLVESGELLDKAGNQVEVHVLEDPTCHVTEDELA